MPMDGDGNADADADGDGKPKPGSGWKILKTKGLNAAKAAKAFKESRGKSRASVSATAASAREPLSGSAPAVTTAPARGSLAG